MLRLPCLISALAFLLSSPPVHAQQAASWQQSVAYEMDVRLDTDRHRLAGRQRLVYANNSPDTLRHVFYHLYFNAFQPTSMMAERNRHLPDPDRRVAPRIFELGPDEIGVQRVESLTQDGIPVTYRVDDTVMQVDLARPILPGASSTFEMEFEAQVPLQTRRSGRDSREGIDYSMTQWYPKMAAYDALGWHADPYVGREFYAPFGTFDVRITLPATYTLGATGVLQNPDAIGHGYGDPAISPTTARPLADSLTWHFRAERVHDFAWTADPDYLHTRLRVDDVPGRTEPVELHFLFQPDVAENWEAIGEQTAELIRFFSAHYGAYPYPQFTVAQGGDGGMEYPMITLITGDRPPRSLLGTTSHELAHMWFYGMVATNEADFAWMDEGFTSYISREALAHLRNADAAEPVSHASAREAIVRLQLLDLYERPSKPADWFETNRAYSAASYSAGEALADLLGYVMGDATRDAFLRAYVERFAFRHPYPADVLAVAKDLSGLQLDWLFEQFLHGERYDYSVDDITVEDAPGGVRSTIPLRRNEPGVLPVDVRLRFADGAEEWVTVPLTAMQGHKPVPADWTVAPAWAWTDPNYDLVVERPSRVVEAAVDPEGRMIDLDVANNRAVRNGPDVPLAFAGFLADPPSARGAITYALSPIAVYSHDYGGGGGAQLRVALPNDRGSVQLGVTLWPAVLGDEARGFDPVLPDYSPTPDLPGDLPFPPPAQNASSLDGVDYTAVYSRRLRALGPHDELRFSARKHLGIVENQMALTKVLGRYPTLRDWGHTLTLTLSHQDRTSDRAFEDYDPIDPPLFLEDTFGFDTGFSERPVLSSRLDYRIGDDDSEIAAFLEVGGSLGTEDGRFVPDNETANRLFVTATKAGGIGPFTGLARLAFGVGSDRLSPQKQFGLGSASVETRWRSDAYRVLATAPDDPQRDAHLFALSGVGPVAYLAAEPYPVSEFDYHRNDPSPYPTTGASVLAGTLALRFGPPSIPGLDPEWRALLAPLQFEVFSGFGSLQRPDGLFLDPVADAGFGVRYDLPAFTLLRGVIAQSDVLGGLRLAAKFPIWASDPERIGPGEEAFGFRWLIGVETGL
ncbi:MAG: M1 family metallopeptidase [Rhodothermales bacterium]